MATPIKSWQTHQAAPGDEYSIAYVGAKVPAGQHDPADFALVLTQRTGVDVIGTPALAGNVITVRVAVTRAAALMSLLGGPYVLSGKNGGMYDYVLSSVTQTKTGTLVDRVLSPAAQLLERGIDGAGNRVTTDGLAQAAANDRILGDLTGSKDLPLVIGAVALLALLIVLK